MCSLSEREALKTVNVCWAIRAERLETVVVCGSDWPVWFGWSQYCMRSMSWVLNEMVFVLKLIDAPIFFKNDCPRSMSESGSGSTIALVIGYDIPNIWRIGGDSSSAGVTRLISVLWGEAAVFIGIVFDIFVSVKKSAFDCDKQIRLAPQSRIASSWMNSNEFLVRLTPVHGTEYILSSSSASILSVLIVKQAE